MAIETEITERNSAYAEWFGLHLAAANLVVNWRVYSACNVLSKKNRTATATRVAKDNFGQHRGAEDLKLGDYVTLLNIICELPSYLWCADATTLSIEEPVRIRLIPGSAGKPLKVQAICLPFVLVKKPSGKQRTLDLRQCRLARLDKTYVSATWKVNKKGSSKRR